MVMRYRMKYLIEIQVEVHEASMNLLCPFSAVSVVII
jgi:hypothetical protein